MQSDGVLYVIKTVVLTNCLLYYVRISESS